MRPMEFQRVCPRSVNICETGREFPYTVLPSCRFYKNLYHWMDCRIQMHTSNTHNNVKLLLFNSEFFKLKINVSS